MAAFDAVILLAGHLAAALAANDDAALLGVDLDVVACEPGKLRGQDERAARLVEIDRRRPAGGVGADDLTDLLLQREQIAKRIPACKSHVLQSSTRRHASNHMCYDCKDIQARRGLEDQPR